MRYATALALFALLGAAAASGGETDDELVALVDESSPSDADFSDYLESFDADVPSDDDAPARRNTLFTPPSDASCGISDAVSLIRMTELCDMVYKYNGLTEGGTKIHSESGGIAMANGRRRIQQTVPVTGSEGEGTSAGSAAGSAPSGAGTDFWESNFGDDESMELPDFWDIAPLHTNTDASSPKEEAKKPKNGDDLEKIHDSCMGQAKGHAKCCCIDNKDLSIYLKERKSGKAKRLFYMAANAAWRNFDVNKDARLDYREYENLVKKWSFSPLTQAFGENDDSALWDNTPGEESSERRRRRRRLQASGGSS